MATGGIPSKHIETIDWIKDGIDGLPSFRLTEANWDNASDPTEDYNCFGFAVGVHKWWQPPEAPGLVRNPRDYWPEKIARKDIQIETFIAAAKTEGFRCCDDCAWKDGTSIIVLCYGPAREFTHAAVQISSGRWKSKFGPFSDIDHDLDEISCLSYGDGRQFMRKSPESIFSKLWRKIAGFLRKKP